MGMAHFSRVNGRTMLGSGLLAVGLAASVLPAEAGLISHTYAFPEPRVETANGYTYVQMDGLREVGNPGEPLLPTRGARILLPPGEAVVGVEVILGPMEALPGEHLVAPGQMEYPLSLPGTHEPVRPNPAIYESSAPFPPQAAVHVTTERVRGYDIAFVRLYPVEYAPARRTLSYCRSLELRVHTAPLPDGLEAQAEMFRSDRRTLERVSRLIDNDGAEETYLDRLGDRKTGTRSGEIYPYLIITDTAYLSIFQDLADFKTAKGMRAKMVRVDSLTANMSGDDDQERIRNYIIEAYQDYGAEYVLLAGDDEIIPHRGLYAVAYGYYSDEDIPADLYYGALDGNWNSDGDGLWGEPSEADLLPEVHVGRAPVDNTTEVTHFVTKTLKYQQDPVLAECATALLAGELLWDDPTYGGDYMEELRLGASTYGYTTAGFPAHFDVDTLYDRGPSNPTWDKEDLIPLLNGGVHLVNHLGHCNTTYALRMVNSDVDTRFTNDGETHSYFIIYTQGCYSASFDNRLDDGSYTSDAIAEHFVTIEHGAVAYIGNSRYGYAAHSSTNGSSHRFHRQFIDALFGEDIYNIGATNDDSKVDNIPFVDMQANRWCYYQICVMGDPELPIWTNTPGTLSLTHDGSCWVGQNEYEVVVTSGRGPVSDALVCLYTDDGDVYATGTTDAFGRTYLDPSATEAATGTLVASAHDYLPTQGEAVTFQVSEDPYVICTGSVVDDDTTAASSGDADGQMDAGETIELSVELKNVGETAIDQVFATLGSGDAFAQVTSDSAYYGTLPAGGSAYGHAPFVLQVGDRCPDGHELPLEVTIDTGRSHGVRHLSFQVGAPVLAMAAYEISDQDDGCPRPTETVDITVTVRNDGTDTASGVVGTLTGSNPYATIVVGSDQAASLGVGETTELAFQVQLKHNCPTPYGLDLPLELSATTGEIVTDECFLWVPGAIQTDFEDGEVGYWTHEAVTPGYVDEWHLTDRKSYLVGTYSWKCGAYEGDYADYADGGLVAPAVCLVGTDTLEFWHRMRAEEGSATEAWDGGFVEISLDDGQTWQQITPVGGYPYTIIDNPDSPFPAGTPCWSGLKDWEFAQFDLSAFTGPARFRFRFGSDGYTTYKGWWVDEVVLRTEAMTAAGEDRVVLFGGPSDFALSQNRPNPFNPLTTIAYAVPKETTVSITVYNVQGQRVRGLVDSTKPAGRHEVTWDGTDETGYEVASGIYFCRMEAGEFTAVNRMILLK